MAKRYKKYQFIKTIRLTVTVLLLLLAIFTLGFKTYTRLNEGRERGAQMRAEYVEAQRKLIKFEVDRVAKLIDYEVDKHYTQAQNISKQRVLEAYAIAKNIHEQNKDTKTEEDIKQIIRDALRPVRFDNGDGYYFIISFDGYAELSPNDPEIEKKNLLASKDSRGNPVVRDLIHTAQSHGEGFHSYFWSKPNSDSNNNQKISYVKHFEPYDWIIGTGTYLSAVEKSMQNIITHYVTANRFGPNDRGYVFINELLNINGGKNFAKVYANPNRPNDTGKTIADDFKDAKGKMFRREFLQGLREHGQCFVDYWYRKIDNPNPSPKTSFFRLAGKGRFIVAAGLYTDDIENKIAAMQKSLQKRLIHGLLFVTIIFLIVFLFTIFIFHWLSKRLENDFLHFVDFFKTATQSSQLINRDNLRFAEFDKLANYANQMLTDKISIEQELDQEKKRLLITLHSIADGVVATDTEGNIQLFNKVAEQLTGWTQEKAQGKNVNDVLDIESSELKNNKGSSNTLATMLSKQHFTLTSRSGKEYKVTMSSAPIYTEDQEIIGNVVVFRDETEKLKTEEELFKAQKLESVGLLAGGIAHDFNNILSGIFGNIELAHIKVQQDEQVKKHLQIALDSLQRAKSLTTQLLTFSRGGEPLTEVVNLKEMLMDVVPFNLSGSSVVAQYSISNDLWHIQADPGQISQVISNLVINAKHAMPTGGTLTIGAKNIPASTSHRGRDTIEFIIGDNGIGMSQEIQNKIFDPYFTTKTDGNGLGLSMVYSIIDKHKGSVSVESAPEKGSTFSIILRACTSTDHETNRPLVTSIHQSKDNGLRILIIEDDHVLQDVLTGILCEIGHSVDVASEGKTGTAMYQKAFQSNEPYHLVLSDLTIPGGMGGKEAVQKILEIDPDAKVIATSGYAMDPIMAQYEKFGFKGRIAKPFRLQDIQREVERVYAL
ncbi:cache domain-containing protein [Desulforhopalus sp. 52FAK]